MITDLKINEEKKKEYYEKGYWTHDTIRDVWERQAQAKAVWPRGSCPRA